MIEYRGYRATVRYDAANMRFVGVIDGIPDEVKFRGTSLEELKSEMARKVDGYVDFCIEWGRPMKQPPYPADLTVRVSAELRALIDDSPLPV